MSNQEPKAPLIELLSPDIEALLKNGFVATPKSFDALIVSRLATIKREQTPELPDHNSVISKMAMLCRLAAMTIGGGLAATEVIAFVFSFWAAGAAL
jgi:hypothetical protein